MRKPTLLHGILLAAATLALQDRSAAAAADELAVIVNQGASVGALNRAQLGAIYRGRTKEFPNGGAVKAVNLPPGTSGREAFDSAVLGLNPDESKRYWIDAKIRSGTAPPNKLPTAAAVARFVAGDPAALGYVPLADAKGVRIVARIRNGTVTAP